MMDDGLWIIDESKEIIESKKITERTDGKEGTEVTESTENTESTESTERTESTEGTKGTKGTPMINDLEPLYFRDYTLRLTFYHGERSHLDGNTFFFTKKRMSKTSHTLSLACW